MLSSRFPYRLLCSLTCVFVLGLAGCSGSESDPTPPPPPPSPPEMISWEAPAARISGEKITSFDIAYYEIWYGKERYNLEFYAQISADGGLDFPVDSLPEGDFFYSLVAIDLSGNRSPFSAPIKLK